MMTILTQPLHNHMLYLMAWFKEAFVANVCGLHIFLNNLKFLAHAKFVIVLKSHLETNQVVLLCCNELCTNAWSLWMNQLGLKFSLQHDEHMYLWFTSCWWTKCICTKPMEVNGNVGAGIVSDGMSTIDHLLLEKLKKECSSQCTQFDKFIGTLHSTLMKKKKLLECANWEHVKVCL